MQTRTVGEMVEVAAISILAVQDGAMVIPECLHQSNEAGLDSVEEKTCQILRPLKIKMQSTCVA